MCARVYIWNGVSKLSPYGVAYECAPKSQYRGCIWMIQPINYDGHALNRLCIKNHLFYTLFIINQEMLFVLLLKIYLSIYGQNFSKNHNFLYIIFYRTPF